MRALRSSPVTTVALVALIFAMAGTASAATPARSAVTQPKKTLTFKVALKIDSKIAAGLFNGSGVTTAEVVAQPLPTTGNAEPTAWEGTGPVTVADERYSGVPFCTISKAPTTGTLHVAVVKSGGRLEVTWSADVNVPPSVFTCPPAPPRTAPSSAVQPFLLLEPKTFTLPAAGGTQALSGVLDVFKNTGTMTVTPREECEPKITSVKAYPPGQATKLSSLAGRGFAPGEKITADTNVEFTFADGSVTRLTKGSSIKQDAKCAAQQDTSRSFRGTLLLGLMWAKVTKVFGDGKGPTWNSARAVNGVRGTIFSIRETRTQTVITVGKGSVWVRRLTRGRPVGPTVIVKAGRTATIRNTGPIVVRRSTRPLVPPFGQA